MAEAIYEGGIRFLEITYLANGSVSDEETAQNIQALTTHFKGKMHIGAGTVLNEKQVELTHQAGGEFIISPDINTEVIKKTKLLGMISMPGALTPTEAQIAHRNGADVYLRIYGRLPSNYISKKDAINAGWINILGNLNAVAPDKVIGGDVYRNKNGHLPSAPGRVWYEADINYDTGYRNDHRLLYSNDGLIFATYDHYMTFVQIH